ncbi:MAG: hypothetical protein DHS20C03_19100 [Minwuia thermotolerans]|nr:MAG: hypothetical protein DHS20C03_19100 [Minwuia thermotolerans]
MIDWNADSPPWQRVADAGFGQAMEDCGFRKVGRTMWRRDGDRIVWRVALTKGYADEPGSFRASYGGFVKEIDELVKLYNPKRSMERMEGTSVPYHLGGTLVDDLIEEVSQKDLVSWRRKWEAEQNSRSGWKGFWKDLIDPIPPKPDVDFSEVPFLEKVGMSSHQWAFVIREEHQVREVTELLLGNFHKGALPWMQERLDFDMAYPRRWGPSDYNRNSNAYLWPEYYAAAKLAGDQDWIEELARKAFAEAPRSLEEVWQDCIDAGDFKRPQIKSGEVSCETFAQNTLRSRLRPAVTVKAIAVAMSLNVPEFEIDMSELERPLGPMR